MLYVIRYMLYVICYMIYVRCYMLYRICYMLYVVCCRQTHIVCYMLYVVYGDNFLSRSHTQISLSLRLRCLSQTQGDVAR